MDETVLANLKYNEKEIIMNGTIGQIYTINRNLIFPTDNIDQGLGYIKINNVSYYHGQIINNLAHGAGQIIGNGYVESGNF